MRLWKFTCSICGKEIVAYSRSQAVRLATVHKRDRHSVQSVLEEEIKEVDV